MKILCIDAGTNNIKSQVFDNFGAVSEVISVRSNGAFDLKKGTVDIDIFYKTLLDCIKGVFTSKRNKEIDAVGLTTIGPSLVKCNNKKCDRIASSYNYQGAKDGVSKVLKMDLYRNRGVGTGSQYTPEQILQQRKDDKLGDKPYFTSVASYLCHLLGADLRRWTHSEASYNGLIDVATGSYSEEIFSKLSFNKNWFPNLTSKESGFLSDELIKRYKIISKGRIPIYCLGTDGPATQAYFGREISTIKFESTGAFRVKGKKPIFDQKPAIKGFPGIWNLFFKEPCGERYFISGSTVNAGVNTIKHYFPKESDEELLQMDKLLIRLTKKGIPDLDMIGVELPFEYGERDGIERKFGIQGQQSDNKILLYYALKEGVVFNMMQRVLFVRNAQEAVGNNLSDGFFMTGAINKSKPWIDLTLAMLNLVVGIEKPKLIKSEQKEIGLASVGKGVLKKMGIEDSIETKGKVYDLKSLSFSLDKNKRMLLKRWKAYCGYYEG